MRYQFEYPKEMVRLIEEFLIYENKKWRREQVLLFLLYLLYYVQKLIMVRGEILFLFSCCHAFMMVRACIVSAMQNRYDRKIFLMSSSEERYFFKFARKKGVCRKWLEDEINAMCDKCYYGPNGKK